MTAVFVAVMLLPCIAVFAQNDQAITSAQTITVGKVVTYWTEERMRNAKPMPFPMAAAASEALFRSHPNAGSFANGSGC